MTTDIRPDTDQFVPTHKGFLMGWRAQPGNTVIMELESVQGVRSSIRARMTAAVPTAEFAESLDRLLAPYIELWLELLIDDGKLIRFHIEPRRAPRNETIRGQCNNLRDLGDGFIEIGLRDEEGLGRYSLIHVSGDIRQPIFESLAARTVIEIDVDSDLEVTAVRISHTDRGNAT